MADQTVIISDDIQILLSETLDEDQLAPVFSDTWTGSQIWHASKLLCEYLHTVEEWHKRISPVDRVIELGSGCGLCGIYAARLGAQVVLTDQQEIVPLLRKNIALNFCADSATTSIVAIGYLWGTAWPESMPTFQRPSHILISDCINPIYGAESWRKLADSIVALAHEETEVFMSHQVRGGDEAFADFCSYSRQVLHTKLVHTYSRDGDIILIHKLSIISA